MADIILGNENKKETKAPDHYKGYNKFQGRLYLLEEVHDPSLIIGKWCIAVEVPGVVHKARVFTMSVRYYDNEPNNDAKDIKRPAIFDSEIECRTFMSELRFPDMALRILYIDNEVCAKMPKNIGCYLVKKSGVALPT